MSYNEKQDRYIEGADADNEKRLLITETYRENEVEGLKLELLYDILETQQKILEEIRSRYSQIEKIQLTQDKILNEIKTRHNKKDENEKEEFEKESWLGGV